MFNFNMENIISYIQRQIGSLGVIPYQSIFIFKVASIVKATTRSIG